MKVLVIGGGLMGSATSFFLAQRGIDVTLIERNRIGTGATIASFGNCRRTARFLPQLPLAHRARQIWGGIDRLLGQDVEFRATGHLRLVHEPESLDDMRAHIREAKTWGLDLQELERDEIRRRFPGVGPHAIGASFSPEDGSANPRLVSPAFAEAASRLGARIVQEAGHVGITHAKGIFSAETGKGRFEADVLINCAGAWGARLAERFGEDVPLEANGPQMGVTEPLPHRILPVIGIWTRNTAQNAYLRQVERGNIVFGGCVARNPVDLDHGHATYRPSNLAPQLRALVRLVPALAGVSVIRTWSGCEGYVADNLPVMGASGTTPGLFHAFGFCGHGFQIGPGVGSAMAELVATGRCETPLAPFAITRFAKASAPRPDPVL